MSRYFNAGVATEFFPRHRALISAVREVLEARSPAMVDPGETFMTGEGEEVCILVIPHHWLGGVSLVVLARPEVVDLRWAVVTDLRDHDQIDIGRVVDRWASVSLAVEQLGALVGQEFSRVIEWSCVYRGEAARPRRIRAYLEVRGNWTGLDVRSKLSLWPWPRREVVERTSLSSADAPTFRLPVPIGQLLKQA